MCVAPDPPKVEPEEYEPEQQEEDLVPSDDSKKARSKRRGISALTVGLNSDASGNGTSGNNSGLTV